jgi:hypothetical protein
MCGRHQFAATNQWSTITTNANAILVRCVKTIPQPCSRGLRRK